MSSFFIDKGALLMRLIHDCLRQLSDITGLRRKRYEKGKEGKD